MVVSIKGKKHWLWRAVNAEGYVLDALVQSRRDRKAGAADLMRKLLKQQGIAPRVMITDKLGSYGAARNELMPGVEHRSHKAREQQSRELSSCRATTRTDDEAVQVEPTMSALRFHPRPDHQSLPLSA